MAVYPVSRVLAYLRDILNQDALLQDIWVRGEVANLARPGVWTLILQPEGLRRVPALCYVPWRVRA